ncbi:hypothetical protein EYZ11_003995 [Aspergillus tanneri]|nr:hypothetical protein EYZ11_003995 [Aspergillus tanneri]
MGMDFVFINVREPRDALQLAKEPEVRSHVARYQWRQVESRAKITRERVVGRYEEIFETFKDSEDDDDDDDEEIVSVGYMQIRRPKRPLPDPSHPLSIPLPLGGLRGDPFSIVSDLVETVSTTVDLMSMAVDIPELDQPGNRGLLRTRWFPLVMTEPALFLVIMLLAASHHATLVPNPSTDSKLDLLRLRCETINAINHALQFQRHDQVSDALVGAIAKMASYEAMFGSMESYDVHMRGLTQAVGLRGGLTELGLDGLLRRIVVWIDRNAAFLHGSSLHFPGATFVLGEPLPDPNPGHFLGAS